MKVPQGAELHRTQSTRALSRLARRDSGWFNRLLQSGVARPPLQFRVSYARVTPVPSGEKPLTRSAAAIPIG